MAAASYSRLTRLLHWLTLLLFLALLASGLASASQEGARPMPTPLLPHMLMGGALLLILLWRIWRKATGAVAPAENQLAEVGHWALLVTMTLMAGSGLATSLSAELMPLALTGGAMPDFSDAPPRIAHGLIYWPLIALVLGHAGMAVWHQWVRRDGTLSRMIRGR